MEAIIKQLLAIEGNSFILMCIHDWIIHKMPHAEVISEIKSIAQDNPPMIERILGTELFTQIMSL